MCAYEMRIGRDQNRLYRKLFNFKKIYFYRFFLKNSVNRFKLNFEKLSKKKINKYINKFIFRNLKIFFIVNKICKVTSYKYVVDVGLKKLAKIQWKDKFWAWVNSFFLLNLKSKVKLKKWKVVRNLKWGLQSKCNYALALNYFKIKYLYNCNKYLRGPGGLKFDNNRIKQINVKISSIFFVGLVQIIYYNATFKQYAFEVYNGFKVDFFLLFFTTFSLTRLSACFLKKYYWFLFKYYKHVLKYFKQKLKRFLFLSNIKVFTFLFKKRQYTFFRAFEIKKLFHFSNSFMNRYIYLFSHIFIESYKNTFNIFGWSNIDTYTIRNNAKIYKYLKIKQLNMNQFFCSSSINKNFFKKIGIVKKFLFRFIYIFCILRLSCVVNKIFILYVLKIVFLNLSIKLCHNLIN